MQIVRTDDELVQAMLDGGRAGAAQELRMKLNEVKNAQAMADTAHAELTQALAEKEAKIAELEQALSDANSALAAHVKPVEA